MRIDDFLNAVEAKKAIKESMVSSPPLAYAMPPALQLLLLQLMSVPVAAFL